MRWLFFFLLALNLLCLLLWSGQVPAPTGAAPVHYQQEDEQSIRLLSELEPGQLKPKSATSHTEASTNSSTCQFLGSLEREDQANALRQRLAGLDIRAQIQAIDLPGALDYWLYLSPLISRQTALQQIETLKTQGIESHLIPQGELSNGISLGLFPRPEQADWLRQRLQEAGYQPQLLELSRTQRRYWLRLLAQQPVDAGTLRILSADFGRLEQRSAPCTNLASVL